jgi:hypothetical protein
VSNLRAGTARPAAVALVGGAALGLAALVAVRFLPHPANLLGTLGGPWLATAFAVGVMTRGRRLAAMLGALSMASAVTAYYVARVALNAEAYGGVTVRGQAIPYLLIGLLAGAGMAVLGALWRSGGPRWRAVAAGLLAGALGAEVIVLTSQAWRGRELALAVLQGGAAVVLAWILPRSFRGRIVALMVGAGSAAVVGGAILALHLKLRLIPDPPGRHGLSRSRPRRACARDGGWPRRGRRSRARRWRRSRRPAVSPR